MSKELSPFALSLPQCEKDVVEFKALLDSKSELDENADIRPFFIARPHLAALIGSFNLHAHQIDRLASELDLFGNFRCDWVVGDWENRSYALIEFEDARPDSIFVSGSRFHQEWGRRFEHGFSQLVDWFWAIDEYRGNLDFGRRFGNGPAQFSGILVIGRREYLADHQAARLKWRLDRVTVNTNKITCITFDDLHDSLKKRVRFIRRLADQDESS